MFLQVSRVKWPSSYQTLFWWPVRATHSPAIRMTQSHACHWTGTWEGNQSTHLTSTRWVASELTPHIWMRTSKSQHHTFILLEPIDASQVNAVSENQQIRASHVYIMRTNQRITRELVGDERITASYATIMITNERENNEQLYMSANIKTSLVCFILLDDKLYLCSGR